MGEKNTIESLISTSVEDDFDALPLFNGGSVIKKISKEEIQGWGQNYNRQPFQKKQSGSRWRKQLNNLKNNTYIAQNFQSREYSPPSLKSIKKQLNHYEDGELFQKCSTFQTMSYFPNRQSHTKMILPKVDLRQEPKQDFVRGVKYTNFVPLPTKNKTLNPIVKPTSVVKKETEQTRCRSVSLRKSYKRGGSDGRVQLISYPVDISEVQQSKNILTKNKLHIFMRKYQI